MEVKIKKLNKDAVIPFKTYPSDFCYDVVAVSEEEIAPNVWKYGLGFALQIERPPLSDYSKFIAIMLRKQEDDIQKERDSQTNISIDLRPRSSIYKTGMILSNSIGTIDENFTNEISAIFYHVFTNLPRYKVGDKIGQIKIGVTVPINFKEVSELEERDRGLNCYGSTDYKQ